MNINLIKKNKKPSYYTQWLKFPKDERIIVVFDDWYQMLRNLRMLSIKSKALERINDLPEFAVDGITDFCLLLEFV